MGIGIVDTSYYIRKTFATMTKSGVHFSTTNEMLAGAIFNEIMKSLDNVRSETNADYDSLVFCFDSTGSEARKTIYPDYKKSRGKQEDPKDREYRIAITKLVEEMIIDDCSRSDSMAFMRIVGYEADDIIWVCCKVLFPGEHKYILTYDSDLWQLVDANTSVIAEKKGQFRFITLENFSEMSYTSESDAYLNPQDYLLGKVLDGDKSDDISGVPGIGKKTANLLVFKYKTVKNMIEGKAVVPEIKIRGEESIMKKFKTPATIEIIKRNFQLIQISRVANNLHFKQMCIEFYNNQMR